MDLTSANVNAVLLDCLFTKEEMAGKTQEEMMEKAVLVKGVVNQFGFNPEKLKKHETEIHDMLKQLPDEFQERSGGGMSFLQACVTKAGVQWAEHRSIDELLCLGLAIKKVQIPVLRNMWNILPGGVPYFTVLE